MTDNEIIKALECHAGDAEVCKLCPLTNEEWCSVKLARKTLDLINRQKAEIERLKDYPKCVYEYDGDITDYCLKTPCPNYKTVDAIKAEAVKEFAERFENKLNCILQHHFTLAQVLYDLDKTKKEMVGENNG